MSHSEPPERGPDITSDLPPCSCSPAKHPLACGASVLSSDVLELLEPSFCCCRLAPMSFCFFFNKL
uniref:Uncharacterized protein n=1 Tax=Arundo donax TaxID=35708 RepID=A0A0A9DFA2_ARUDO